MRTLVARRLAASRIARDVAGVVRRGGTVIFPTDTVYGIGCDPADRAAVEKIFALKGRPRDKPLSVHVATVAELLQYAPGNALAVRAAAAFLPGPLTLVVRRPAFVGDHVTAGLATLGLRCPNHALCAAILERCGPLAATSANFSGLPAFTGSSEAATAALPLADVCVDDGPTPVGVESTIVDVTENEPRLVREGAIGAEMIEQHLGVAVLNADGSARSPNGAR